MNFQELHKQVKETSEEIENLLHKAIDCFNDEGKTAREKVTLGMVHISLVFLIFEPKLLNAMKEIETLIKQGDLI